MKNRNLSLELIKEAKKHPNGWIYVLDKKYEGKEEVREVPGRGDVF